MKSGTTSRTWVQVTLELVLTCHEEINISLAFFMPVYVMYHCWAVRQLCNSHFKTCTWYFLNKTPISMFNKFATVHPSRYMYISRVIVLHVCPYWVHFLSPILKLKSFEIFPLSHLTVFYFYSKWLGSEIPSDFGCWLGDILGRSNITICILYLKKINIHICDSIWYVLQRIYKGQWELSSIN